MRAAVYHSLSRILLRRQARVAGQAPSGILAAVADRGLHPARWWHPAERGKLLCTLCPRYCLVGEGQAGFCYIRQNHGGRLWSAAYGRSTGFAVDPIEKKPLNHFLPGARVLSFGTAGCNLGCKFCQNWDISKARLDQHDSEIATPDDVVRRARRIAPAWRTSSSPPAT
jgi:pyruvate formate lyase activating enzyme